MFILLLDDGLVIVHISISSCFPKKFILFISNFSPFIFTISPIPWSSILRFLLTLSLGNGSIVTNLSGISVLSSTLFFTLNVIILLVSLFLSVLFNSILVPTLLLEKSTITSTRSPGDMNILSLLTGDSNSPPSEAIWKNASLLLKLKV